MQNRPTTLRCDRWVEAVVDARRTAPAWASDAALSGSQHGTADALSSRDRPPFVAQPKMNHPVAAAALSMSHVNDALAPWLVAIITTLIAKHAAAHARHAQRTMLR